MHYEKKRPSREEIESRRSEVWVLHRQAQSVSYDANSTHTPSEEFFAELNRNAQWAEQAVEQYQNPREEIQAYLSVNTFANFSFGTFYLKTIPYVVYQLK